MHVVISHLTRRSFDKQLIIITMLNQEKMFVCLLCSHMSKSQLSMRSHVMETHVPEESFYRKNSMSVDKQIHLPRNEHTCLICLRLFRKKCHLKNHMRSHAPRRERVKRHGSSFTRNFLYRISSYNLQPVRRSRRTIRRPLQHDEHDTSVREPLQNTVLQSKTSGHISSFSSVNWWPKVVLSSHLNLLLSRISEMHTKM